MNSTQPAARRFFAAYLVFLVVMAALLYICEMRFSFVKSNNVDERVAMLDEMFGKLGRIERRLHTTWRDKSIIDKDYSIIVHGMRALRDLNPHWHFNISDNHDVDAYIKSKISREDYDLIRNKHIVEKTDLWRLLKIYHEGGVYIDIDKLCNMPMKRVLELSGKRAFVNCILPTYYDTDFAQDTMICVSGNPISKLAIDLNLQRRRLYHNNPFINPLFYLGPKTFMHAVTRVVLGKQIDRRPAGQPLSRHLWHVLQEIITKSRHLYSYREIPAFNTTLYRGPPIRFDKSEMYKSENISVWNLKRFTRLEKQKQRKTEKKKKNKSPAAI